MLVQLRRCRPSEPKALSLYSMLVGSNMSTRYVRDPGERSGGVVPRASVDSSVRTRRRSSSRHLDCFEAARSVNTGRSLPIENVNQLPRVPDKIHLQLSLLINRQLGCRVQDTRALALIGVVHIEFASG
jgi:hypothetical protein